MPVESLFVFLLIISGNFLAELFPCRFQKKLTDVIALKHFFGYLTLLFFVVLQTPLHNFMLLNSIKQTTGLYIIFLILINSHYTTFIISMFLLSISYVLTLKQKENISILETITEDDVGEQDKELALQKSNNNIELIQNYLHIFLIISIALGFLSYLGSKKAEYKSNFNYFTFIFGKTSCANDGNKLTYIKGLLNAFS